MQIHLSNQNQVIGLFLFVAILILSSCGGASHHFYATDEGNLLALKEEKDLKVSAGYMPHLNSLPGNNLNVQAAYSPIKHLGVYTNYFRIRNAFEAGEGIQQNVYQYHFGAAIGGYIFKQPEAKTETVDEDRLIEQYTYPKGKGLLFDAYLGYNQGRNKNFFFEETGTINIPFQKFYLQGGAHIFMDRINASFALKYARLSYFDGEAFGKLTNLQLRKVDVLEEQNPFDFLESSLKVSYGKPETPFQAYITIAGIYDFGDAFLEIQPSTMQVGITADIDHFFGKKKKKK